MNSGLNVFNFLGICAVAVLCGVQWRSIVHIDADRDRLELVRQSQVKQIADDTKKIADQASDLEDFRNRLKRAEDELIDLQQKLTAATVERDRLQTALKSWKAAVEARDATLKQANTMIESLAKQRDAAIAQFNDTAVKYNELVKKMSQ